MRRSISARPARRPLRTRAGGTVKPKPERTCVACHQVKTKRELVRLVRTPEGTVEIDISSKKAGRGAYLCRAKECWETALKSGRVEHSLKIPLDQHHREQLLKE